MAVEMFKIDVAGAEPALVCSECLADEERLGESGATCTNSVGGVRCSNDGRSGISALHSAVRRRRESGARGPTLYRMVMVPTT